MQIRFATMGKKNKHERNPKQSTEKVWNPKKEKNHKTKRQICKHFFFGFALLSCASRDYANQICTRRGRKINQRSPKKNTEKVWNPKKEKNHKTKRQICKHCFLALVCFGLLSSVSGDYGNQIYNDGEEKKKHQRNPKKNTGKSPEP